MNAPTRTRVLVIAAISAGAIALSSAVAIGSVAVLHSAIPQAPAAPTREATDSDYDDSVDSVVALGETGENHAGIAFTVTSVDCDGLTEIHDGDSIQPADGEFCLVGLEITNNGDEPYLFWETYAAAGIGEWIYRVDSVATLWNGESTKYTEPIPEGATISTELVFDVPYGETIEYFQFGQAIVSGLVLVDTSEIYDAGS